MSEATIKYVEGDLFGIVPSQCKPNDNIFIAHVANDVGAWGAGFVVPLGKRYPQARQAYLDWHRAGSSGHFAIGESQFVDCAPARVFVCNMVAQRGVGGVRPLRYTALASCMEKVGDRAKQERHPIIYAPFFGSDLAGGDWNFVEKLIEDAWISRKIPVVICYLAGRTPPNFTIPEQQDA